MAALEEVDNSLYSQHQKVFPQISVSLKIKPKPAQIKNHLLRYLFSTSPHQYDEICLDFYKSKNYTKTNSFPTSVLWHKSHGNTDPFNSQDAEG